MHLPFANSIILGSQIALVDLEITREYDQIMYLPPIYGYQCDVSVYSSELTGLEITAYGRP